MSDVGAGGGVGKRGWAVSVVVGAVMVLECEASELIAAACDESDATGSRRL